MEKSRAGRSTGKAESKRSAQIAYEWLRRRMFDEGSGTEGFFVTEAEVVAATGLSRTPVREAIVRLEAQELLDIIPKKGAYISPVSPIEVDWVMEARSLIEMWCMRQISAGVAAGLIPALNDIIDKQAELVSAPYEFIEADGEFHLALVRGAGNPILEHMYEDLADRQMRLGIHAVKGRQDRAIATIDEHRAVVAALQPFDSAAAEKALDEHLSVARDTLRRAFSSPLKRR